MIVLDTSALIAIALDEPEAEACVEQIARTDEVMMSAANLSEALIVARGRGFAQSLDVLLSELAIAIEPVTEANARQAADAYAAWGKGFHPARLNFGDCFAYALAKARNCPLLFVGDDFKATDVRPALA